MHMLDWIVYSHHDGSNKNTQNQRLIAGCCILIYMLLLLLFFAAIFFFSTRNIVKCTKDHKSQRSIKILLFTIKTMRLQTFYCRDTYGVAGVFFMLRCCLLAFGFSRLWRRPRWCSRRTLFFIVCNVVKVIINKARWRVRNKEMQRIEMKHEIECKMKYFHFFLEHISYILLANV